MEVFNKQAAVAQLVEQLIRNQQVNGSSPFSGSLKNRGLRLCFSLPPVDRKSNILIGTFGVIYYRSKI